MATDKYKKIGNAIKKHLRDKGKLETIDNHLIDELCYNYKLADLARDDIEKNGITVNLTKDPDKPPYLVTNQAVSIYNNAIKNVQTISTKLGITGQERNKIESSTGGGKTSFAKDFLK